MDGLWHVVIRYYHFLYWYKLFEFVLKKYLNTNSELSILGIRFTFLIANLNLGNHSHPRQAHYGTQRLLKNSG